MTVIFYTLAAICASYSVYHSVHMLYTKSARKNEGSNLFISLADVISYVIAIFAGNSIMLHVAALVCILDLITAVIRTKYTKRQMTVNYIPAIYSEVNLVGIAVSEDYIFKLLNTFIVKGKTKEDLVIINLSMAWDYMLGTLSATLNLEYVMNICRVLHPFHAKELKDTAIDESIQSIVDPVAMFIYLMKQEAFANDSIFIAHLIANKMLINADRKMLIIPIDKIEEFQDLADDEEKLYAFLTNCITAIE